MSAAPADDEDDVAVAHALGSLVPRTLVHRVRTGARCLDDADVAALHPEERVRAVASRVRERATGRALLRALLRHDGPIGVLPSGAPAVPQGALATLAHDDALAIAATCERGAGVRALGIDLERVDAARDLAREVLRDDERGLDPTVAFVAKEAAYKAWSALGGRFLAHHDVRIIVDGSLFRAFVDGAAFASGTLTTVRDRVVALVVVE